MIQLKQWIFGAAWDIQAHQPNCQKVAGIRRQSFAALQHKLKRNVECKHKAWGQILFDFQSLEGTLTFFVKGWEPFKLLKPEDLSTKLTPGLSTSFVHVHKACVLQSRQHFWLNKGNFSKSRFPLIDSNRDNAIVVT